MQVHIFKGPPPKFGFTTDRNGSNLPASEGPWEFFKTKEINPDDALIGGNPQEILNGIAKDGYYIDGAGIKFRES